MKMTDFNLPANLDIDNHRDLPGLVKHGIRLGFIATVRRETVRQVVRLVDQARAAAIPDSDLLIVLASAMMHDRPDGFAPDWHPYQVILRDLAWAMCSSSTGRSEEHTSELQSLMRISYAVFCLKKKKYNYSTNEDTQLKTST